MNSFFTLHSFLEVGKTQDLPSKFWQTLGDALTNAFYHTFTSIRISATTSVVPSYLANSAIPKSISKSLPKLT
jgi:hypothetical protein